jgi:hypothetical protein
MHHKLILALPILIAALLAMSGTAQALPCNPDTDPDCDPGGGTTVTHPIVHLFVDSPSAGTVTDNHGEISCGTTGSDCSENYTSTRTCADFECTSTGPSVTVTASGYPVSGYTAQLSVCDTSASGVGCTNQTFCGFTSCTLEMNQNWRLKVAWVDTTAPTAPGISGPTVVGPSVRHFNASGSTDNSGSVSSYRYYLDDVDEGLVDAGTGFDVPVDSLSAGTHKLSARGRDGTGNESDNSSDFSFTVDKSTDVSISSPAADGGHFNAPPQVTFGDAEAGQAVCTTLKGGAPVSGPSSCTSPYTPDLAGSGDGDYLARIDFTDAVGNTDRAERSFRIDTGDPNVTITTPASGQHLKSPFTPAFTATDGGTASGSLVKKCKVDAGAYVDCGPLTVADGPHTLSVKATDEAGNVREVSVGFVADSTGPVVTINSGPADDSIITRSSATYGWTASDASSPLAQTCKLDAAAATACASPKTFASLSEGSHTFTVKVADALGNATEVSREVFVNAVRPSVTITSGPAEGAVLNSKSVTFGFKPAGGGAVSCSLDSETAYRPCSGATSDTLSSLSEGAHTFRVRVRDQSDDTAVASRAFAVDTTSPPRKVLNPSLSSSFDRFPKYTVYKRLVLKRVPAGSTVTVKCKGKKCPRAFKKKAKGTVKLSKFTKRKLRPGTKLTIRVTKPNTIGKQFVILIRKNKAPKVTISQIA